MRPSESWRRWTVRGPWRSRATLSALALVARRPQGLPVHRPSEPCSSDPILPTASLLLHSTRSNPLIVPVPHRPGNAQPAFQRFPPLRHIQPEEPALSAAEKPSPLQLAVRAVSTASTTSRPLEPPRCFHPERPWGSPFRAFSPSMSGRQVSLAPLPSCRLASVTEPHAACATHGCNSAPTAGLHSHRRVRTSRADCSGRRGPAALLSLLPLQGIPPPRVAEALRPRSPLALPLGGVSRRVVRHRGATHEEVGFASLDARLPS